MRYIHKFLTLGLCSFFVATHGHATSLSCAGTMSGKKTLQDSSQAEACANELIRKSALIIPELRGKNHVSNATASPANCQNLGNAPLAVAGVNQRRAGDYNSYFYSDSFPGKNPTVTCTSSRGSYTCTGQNIRGCYIPNGLNQRNPAPTNGEKVHSTHNFMTKIDSRGMLITMYPES